MIIAEAKSDEGSKILLLGITAENVIRLVGGKPMYITRKTHGKGVPEGLSIAILYGDTEQQIFKMLQDAGAVLPETKVVVEPKLKVQP